MTRTRAGRNARTLLIALLLSLATATSAKATPLIKLEARLTPEQLGGTTTISYSVQITPQREPTPPPLTTMDIYYPANLGIVSSGLGLATCSLTVLETLGSEGCPPNSLMGYGSATVDMAFGAETVPETGEITTWMTSIEHGHLGLLIYADGKTPLASELIFPAFVLEAQPPYGGDLNTQIPKLPQLPEGAPATLVRLNASIGPRHITYYKRHHGKMIAYHPNGLRLPTTCPHHGFPFAATFTYRDGTHARAHTTVPCPKHGKRPSTRRQA
jgi:hypothetical protein